MSNLTENKCESCQSGVKPLSEEEYSPYLKQIKNWKIENNKVQKGFEFENFKEALIFVNKVGDLAESEGHHPNIFLYNWNKVRIILYTHAIGGLSKNDFIVAAKIDNLF
jgi:4a-hydroxytetrahydrobiopterin dehydratase